LTDLPARVGAEGVGRVVEVGPGANQDLAGVKTLNLVRRAPAASQVVAAGGDKVIVVGDDLPGQLNQALEGSQLALVLDSIGGPAVVLFILGRSPRFDTTHTLGRVAMGRALRNHLHQPVKGANGV
jgi:NADPH:quinone reductase-like Zn-dependent oxidoreductase